MEEIMKYTNVFCQFAIICSFFITNSTLASVTSGIGTSSRSEYTDLVANSEFYPPKGEEEWCISKITDDQIRCSSVSHYYLFTPGNHDTICTVGVTLTKVIKSENGKIALDSDYFSTEGHKMWAYDNDNSANFTLENIPAFGVKTLLNSMINIVNVFNSLDGIKSNLYQKLASGPEMIEALKSELNQKSCTNYKLSSTFTEKTVSKTTLHKVNDICQLESYGNGFKACGFKSYTETFQQISYPVDSLTGKIDRSQPISHSETISNKKNEKFCAKGNYEWSAIHNCKNLSEELKFQLTNQ